MMLLRRMITRTRLARRRPAMRLGCESLERRLALATVKVGPLTFNVTGAIATVTDCLSTATKVAVPATVAIGGGRRASVVGIDIGGFDRCRLLTSVTIPASVTSIEAFAFEKSTRLKTILVDAKNPSYTSIDGALFSKDSQGLASMVRSPAGKAGPVVIPAGVRSIGYDAFHGCAGMTILAIPASMTDFGISLSNLLEDCKGLTTITVDAKNSKYAGVDGVLYSKNSGGIYELLKCPAGRSGAVSIASGTRWIAVDAFAGCRGVTSVTVPASVHTLGSQPVSEAFSGCSGLRSIDFSGGPPNIGYFEPGGPWGEEWRTWTFDADCPAVARYSAKNADWAKIGSTFAGLKTLAVPPPSAPATPAAVAGDGTVTISWKAPSATGNAAVTDYVIQFSRDTGKTWTVFNDGVSAATSTKVTGLVNNQSHLFRVAAITFAGTGAFSANSQPITPRK